VGTDPRTARRNAVLAGLDGTALAAVLPDLRETALSSGGVLHEAGQPIQEVHFPLVGVVSVVADLGADQAVETATVGREGMVGISVFLDSGVPTEQALVQVPGEALTMSAEALRQHLTDVDGALTSVLRRSASALFTQVSRNAACNRVHTVRQRAAAGCS
jgi:CRP-like cAMP-binding protein